MTREFSETAAESRNHSILSRRAGTQDGLRGFDAGAQAIFNLNAVFGINAH